MTPIVIPLHPRGGKFGTDLEARFAIRSIKRHFKGEHHIAIVSAKLPDWATDCEFVPDGGQGLKTALRVAAERFPDGFFWWYDDCVLLRDQTADELKVTLTCRKWSRAQTSWSRNLERIRQRLVKEGIVPWDYSRPHGPYWFTKAMIDEAFADWPGMKGKFPFESWILSKHDWPRRHGGYRQYYGPWKSPPGEHDVLINYNDRGNTPELRAFLAERFPDPRVEVRASMPKLAVSFSLYGMGSKYAVGAIQNIALVKKHYPGADAVIHAEQGHYAIPRLVAEGAKVIEHAREDGHRGMLWRYLTTGYEAVLFRDADSRIGEREVSAVGEWLDSGKALHCMRDHAQHRHAIMGGMWGLRSGAFDLVSAVADWAASGKYGDDEDFLQAVVWPPLKGHCVYHSSRDSGDGFLPFKVEGPFVGAYARLELPNTRAVYLSPTAHEARRERFLASVNAHGQMLLDIGLDWFVGTPKEKTYCPPSFRDVAKRPHWWAATCDHLRIMEEALADGVDSMFLLEDDADLKPDFEEVFWRAWCALPAGWKALRLGWHHYGHAPVVVPNVLHRADTDSGLMSATFWSRAGLHRAYDHFWHRRKMIIDMAFRDLRKREPHDWYQPPTPAVLIDPLAVQRGRETRRVQPPESPLVKQNPLV